MSADLPAVPDEVSVRVTRYDVNAYPDPDSVNASHYTITVEHRGNDRWGVCHFGKCLGKSGQWSYESNPSSRTDRWLNAYRHDLETALKLARKAVPKVRINGFTPAECWEWERQQRAKRAVEAADAGQVAAP